jgi:hypothetical protein
MSPLSVALKRASEIESYGKRSRCEGQPGARYRHPGGHRADREVWSRWHEHLQFSKEQLEKLPYINFLPRDGRVVPLQAFFDSAAKDWHLYVPHSDKELIRLADGEIISGSYLGQAPADASSDIDFPLGTLVIQHLSFPAPLAALGNLENDVHRCAAILHGLILASILNTSLSTVRQREIGEKHPSGASLKLLNLLDRKGLEAVI